MDGWLCGDCKSLNTPRAASCYRCNVPRRFGERAPEEMAQSIVRTGLSADPAAVPADLLTPVSRPPGTLPPGAAAAAAAARPRPTLADARSSRLRSVVLLVLLGLTTAWSALTMALVLARGGTLGLALDILSANTTALGVLLIAGLISALLTLATAVAWFIWFDRVLRNVPALTGQWPDSGRLGAVGWWLVPIIGLVKAPRIVGDVYHRMSVAGTPGLWLLALWALTWIGGTVVAWVVPRILAFLPLGLELYVGLSDLVALLGQASYVAAGFFAVALVLAIEHASEARRSGDPAVLAPVAQATEDRLEAAFRAAAEANLADRVTRFGGEQPAARIPGMRDAAPDATTGPLPTSMGTSTSTPAAAGGLPSWSDPGFTGSAGRRRTGVSLRAMGILGVAVVVAVVGGTMIAGPRSPDPFRDPAAAFAAPLRTPRPAATADPAAAASPGVAATGGPAATAAATAPAPTPSAPRSWIAAAERLAADTFAEDWVGRMDIEATLRAGNRRTVTWSTAIARVGTDEWSRSRLSDSASDIVTSTETVVLPRTTWTRLDAEPWERRGRTFGDHPSEPLFGIRDASGLAWVRTFKEGGRTLHEFRIPGASDLLALGILRAAGVGPVARTGATVVADDSGIPVRATLSYAGTTRAGRTRLAISIDYRDVGSDLAIQSPRDGDPVVG